MGSRDVLMCALLTGERTGAETMTAMTVRIARRV
jgi:hypothetical protein